LLEKAAYFRKNLGLKGLSGRSQIVPVVVGDDSRVLSLADGLKKRGWWVLAVRPPTVPPKGARLRLSVTMHHDIKVLDDFTEDLSYCLKKET
nr:8-amino-7-oxononanoate synthase [Candidatus Omnitrophota bacterium]